jgi:hypothetical protein
LLEQFRSALAGAGIADRYQYELYLRQGIEQLRQFFECARNAPAEVVDTECRFELQVASAKVAGRVDRVDRTGIGTVAIVDYKTGKPRSQEDADESLQLSLYALAAREVWGKQADRLIFYNLENNTPILRRATMLNWRKQNSAYRRRLMELRWGSLRPSPDISVLFVPTAIFVRRRRRWSCRSRSRQLTKAASRVN